MNVSPKRAAIPVLLAVGCAGICSAEVCQTALLRNGSSIEYVRTTTEGAATRLWLCSDAGAGYVEIPSEQIDRLEQGQRTIATPASTPAAAVETAARPVPVTKGSMTDLIATVASRHRIDPDFVASVVKAESGFNPAAVSLKGAQGLMQLMPKTAAWLHVDDVLDPAANLEGGTRYLRDLLQMYNGDPTKALAAYNAGPGRVEQYGGVPPYRETRAYVARVINDYNRRKQAQPGNSGDAPTAR